MFRLEWRKQLLYRKSLWLIVALLLAEILGVLFFTQPYDKKLEENRLVYDSYLSEIEGPLTEEKRTFLETEMNRLTVSHQEMENVKRRYSMGTISEEVYRNQFDILLEDEKLYAGFGKLYDQYIYVREAENRSFLYTGGWETLLTGEEPDYLLLILLILVITPIFCEEYTCQMQDILLTQKKSTTRIVWVKIGVALLFAAGVTALIQLFELGYCAVRFGLPDGNFTLQSLKSFAETQKDLSIWQGFWIQFVLKEIGSIYAAVVILFLSVCLKKFAWTLMSCIAILPIPFLSVSQYDVFLRIPGPWAIIVGNLYLKPGDLEMTVSEICGIVLQSLLLMGLLLFAVWRKNRNHHLHTRKRRTTCIIFGLVAVSLIGCSSQNESTVLFNRSTAHWYETDQCVIVGQYDGAVLIDKQNGEIRPFLLDAFTDNTISMGTYFYNDGENLYYRQASTLHPTAGWDSVTAFDTIIQMDLQSMDTDVFYQWNLQDNWFFGLVGRESQEPVPVFVNEFFIHGNFLYFANSSEGSLHRMNLTTGIYETIFDQIGTANFAYDGQHLYYTDNYDRLTLRNLDSGEEQTVENVVAEKFLLTENGIYFLSRRDRNTLYHWDACSGNITKRNDIPARDVFYDHQYLWIIADENSSLYRMNHDGSDVQEIPLDGNLLCIPNGDMIYCTNFTTSDIYAVDKGQ